ncbi:UPF0058 family protein [Methanocaldococcus infernus]|uniref:Uncharacterized protein n=1 Tax=Methanocaldococcus infernus (strain DSM 11812 / JCM 15783 / ME) TaxID=573063 RepID=D5VS93_METIM|nr:UPF0058 family protein [Methanocaldococcus infernus]ADG13446.1 Protein of unknown function UPF0058 [Methanocaldococcus infernus ME]
MNKDELIQLHQLLIYIRKYIQKKYNVSDEKFEEYDNLHIYPHHIHKTKIEHIYAIFILSSIISRILSEHEKVPKSISNLLMNCSLKISKEITRKRRMR